MKAVVLESSSKGNCIALQGENGTVLLDCGISARRILNLLPVHGIAPKDVKAILVTHDHSDHCCGLRIVKEKTGAFLRCSPGTAVAMGIEPNYTLQVGGVEFLTEGIKISSFMVPHDACDPRGFVVEVDGHRIGYCIDSGYVSQHMAESLQGVELLFLESNHDPEMLSECAHHDSVKYRVKGDRGHLSNFAAGELVGHLVNHGLKSVVLCHLSEESNTPELAISTVSKKANGITVQAAQPGLTISSL